MTALRMRRGPPFASLIATSLAVATAGCSAAVPRAPASDASSVNAGAPRASIAWIENDYPRALAEAKRRGVPLVVDVWAAWCAPCIGMRAFTFDEPALTTHAHNFVWLAMDRDRPETEALLETMPIDVLPTLFVLDAKSATPVLKWEATMNADELATLLAPARAEALGEAQRGGPGVAAFRAACRAAAVNDKEAAARAIPLFEAARATLPAGSTLRGLAAMQLGSAYAHAKRFAECVALARSEIAELPAGSPRADVAGRGQSCAEALAPNAPNAQAPAPSSEVLGFEADQLALARNPRAALIPTDRGDLFDALARARTKRGDIHGADELNREWLAFLDAAWTRAERGDQRAALAAQFLRANRALGHRENALATLERAEALAPSDYNAPARIAYTLAALGRHDEALVAIERAIAKATLPRRLEMLGDKAEILKAKGDAAAEANVLDLALEAARPLELKGWFKEYVARLQARRDELSKAAPPAGPR